MASDDRLLPRAVPRNLGTIASIVVMVLLVAMVLAAVAGGVEWLIGVGGAGTALGTLGLAYFTFAVAERTTELVDSSQRLEAAASGELAAGRDQALEAQKTRIDALAPILDLRVEFREAHAAPRGITPAHPIVLSTEHGQALNTDTASFDAGLNLWLHNFGRTPAFANTTYTGAAFEQSAELIRLDPGAQLMLQSTLGYVTGVDDPFQPRPIRFEMEVRGAISGGPLDVIEWRGEITLLERDVGGWHLKLSPIRVISYTVTRRYEHAA